MREPNSLKSLRERPFEILLELERRGRAATATSGADSNRSGEWVGVALKMAGEVYLVAREEAREVLGMPQPLTRVPGARSFIRGLANVHGQLVSVIDLRDFLGSGATPATRNTRVVVVNHRDIPVGLIVDEVLGFRRFNDSEFTNEVPPTVLPCGRFVAGSFRRGPDRWPVLGLRMLVEDPGFSGATA